MVPTSRRVYVGNPDGSPVRDPFTGIGKPEPLKYHLPGAWSRRIDDEHRLVYVVTDKEIIVLVAHYHY